jgi:hypothetical protein
MRALSLPAEIALTCLVTCKFVLFSNPPVLDVSLPFAGPGRGRSVDVVIQDVTVCRLFQTSGRPRGGRARVES